MHINTIVIFMLFDILNKAIDFKTCALLFKKNLKLNNFNVVIAESI